MARAFRPQLLPFDVMAPLLRVLSGDGSSQAEAFVSAVESTPFSMTIDSVETFEPQVVGQLGVEGFGGAIAGFAPITVRFDDGPDQALTAIYDTIQGHGSPGAQITAELNFPEGERESYVFFGDPDEGGPAMSLIFGDGSSARLELDGVATSVPSLDAPQRLSEPIGRAEYGSIEALIGGLQGVVNDRELDEATSLRVQGAIDVLRGTHRAIQVGDTPRGEVIGTIKSVIRYLYKEIPGDLVKWRGALAIIQDIYPSILDFFEALI